MDNTLYVGMSRQVALQRALDVTANNLANMDTVGFKVERLAMETDAESPPNVPGQGPIKYVVDNGLVRNFGQGGLNQTSNPMDVAIEGDGFFAVQTPGGVRYTRDGRFSINAQNQLVDHAGNAVLSSGGAPITVDPKKSDFAVAKDGSISQGGAGIGKIGVSRFADLSTLKKQGDNLYDPGGAAPVQATDARVHQSMLEHSNVQPIIEMTTLISITRAYERVTQMMAQTEDLSQSAVQRLGRAA